MRHAFTLVEAMVASCVAAVVLTLLYQGLTFYTRATVREDERLERSRRGQEILSLLRDDYGRASGSLSSLNHLKKFIGDDELSKLGWNSGLIDLMTKPRNHRRIISAFPTHESDKPRYSKMLEARSYWTTASVPGDTTFVLQLDSLGRPRVEWVGDACPLDIEKLLGRGPDTGSVAWITKPPGQVESSYLVMGKNLGGGVESVVFWAYHGATTGKIAAGSLMRHEKRVGLANLGADQMVDFLAIPTCDLFFVDPQPPKYPLPVGGSVKMMLRVGMAFGRNTKLAQGPDPGYEISSWLLANP